MPIRTTTKVLQVCCDSISVGDAAGLSFREPMATSLRAAGVDPRWVVTAQSGSRCAKWFDAMPELLKANKVNYLILNCGTNDPGSTTADLDLFRAHYQSMIDAARGLGVRVIMAKLQISRYPAPVTPAWLPSNEASINTVLAEIAASNPDVALADLSLIEATEASNSDGIHPVWPDGYAAYANAYFQAGHIKGWW